MLRESSQHNGDDIDLQALTEADGGASSGVPHGDLLVAFAEAVTLADEAAIDEARGALQRALGDAAVVDAAGIIGMFSGLDRVADATGAPLEDWKAADSAELRAAIGIDSFAATKAALEKGASS
jgi:alkylhydroperoxidase family enzyme